MDSGFLEKGVGVLKQKRLFWIVSGILSVLAASGGILMLYCNNPAETAWFPKCVLYSVTGLYCSGCGTTRALHAALHGDFIAAFRYNVLLFPACLLIALMIWKPRLTLRPWFSCSILIVILLYWIFRNIPVYPFLLLAPPQ